MNSRCPRRVHTASNGRQRLFAQFGVFGRFCPPRLCRQKNCPAARHVQSNSFVVGSPDWLSPAVFQVGR